VYAERRPQRRLEPPRAATAIGRWRASWSDDQHAAAVAVVRAAIARGDVYQANVVAHRSADFAGDPAAVSALLGAVRRTPYSGALSGAGWSVHSASPECLLEVTSGRVLTRPIKGTAPRSDDPGADGVARAGLLVSAKDRAEHVMIVDLERNDLARVCRTGSIAVPTLYDVRPLAGVWHAESTVVGELRSGVGLSALLAATFPGGSVTGAPKIAALDLVDGIEPVGRGPSMGALGWVGTDGTVRLGLTIRTFAVCDGAIHLWTGGGITWGSVAAAEVAEAHAKAAPLLAALAPLSG
jgi:para-aminobenzoate synthetase component 1